MGPNAYTSALDSIVFLLIGWIYRIIKILVKTSPQSHHMEAYPHAVMNIGLETPGIIDQF